MALSQEQLQRLRQRRSGNRPVAQEQQDTQPRGSLAQALAQGSGQEPEGRFFRDTGIDLAQGALRLPGMVAGLADIGPAGVLGNRPVRRATSAIADATGFKPGEWADSLEQYQSPALQEAQSNVNEAFEGTGTSITEGRYGDALRGAGRGAMALATNPRALASTVFESVPSMIAAGGIGRGLQALSGVSSPLKLATQQAGISATAGAGRAIATGQAASFGAQQAGRRLPNLQPRPRLGGIPAAGIGEGAVMAGMAMNELGDDVDPRRAALAATGIGIGGGLIGVGGGMLAQKLGVINPEQVFLGRTGSAGTELGRGRNLPARVAGGFVSEGFFEEMPQESLETIATNWAEGEPLFNNVPRAAIEGLMAGGVMGGAMNIRRPRGPADVTTLTGQPPATEPDSPDAPSLFNAADADVADMMRYHRRLVQVAQSATEQPELQQSAIERIETVLSELDKRGIPREVVNEELAKKKYQDIEDQASTLGIKYNQALQTNPQLARSYLEKIQGLVQQKQALEQQYPRNTLLGPDYETVQELKTNPAASDFFRVVKDERTNQLKPMYQKKLAEFREMPLEQLRRVIARNRADDTEGGGQGSRLAPLAEAAGRARGITETDIAETQRAEFGARESAPLMPGENDPNPLAEDELTDEEADAAASVLTEGSDTEQALVQRQAQDVPRETPGTNVTPATREMDPRWQALSQAANQSAATRDAVWAVGEAIAEMEAGINEGTALQRAGELYAQRRPKVKNPRQALDNVLRGLSPRLRSLTNNPEMPELTAQSIIERYTQGLEASEAAGSTAGTSIDGQVFDENAGSMRSIESAGGTTNEADATRIKQGIRETVNQQITRIGAASNVATAAEQASQWVTESTGTLDPQEQTDILAAIDNAKTPAQVAKVLRDSRARIVDALTAQQTNAAPPRPKRTPERIEQQRLERERMIQESQQAAQQRQQERQEGLADPQTRAEAREVLATVGSRAAGGKWNKRANAWWAQRVPDQPMVTWDQMVDQYTPEALSWVVSVQEIEDNMQMEPDEKRDALRELFEDYTNAFATGTAQQNAPGQGLISAERPAELAAPTSDAAAAQRPRESQADAGQRSAVGYRKTDMNPYLGSGFVYHAVRNAADIGDIVRNGLRPQSNLSFDTAGQSFDEDATILVFRQEDAAPERKTYQNDGLATKRAKPVAIMVETSAVEQPAAPTSDEVVAEFDAVEQGIAGLAQLMETTTDEVETQITSSQISRDWSFFGERADRAKKLARRQKWVFDNLDAANAEVLGTPTETTTPQKVVEELAAQHGLPVYDITVEFDETTESNVVRTNGAVAPAPSETIAEPNTNNPGTEVVESRETLQQRSDRYATDPRAALAELREALDDLAIALQQAENERSSYDAKKLARIQREANKVFNNIGKSSPDAVAKAVYDTYEVVSPVAADRARDEALAAKERKRAEREERTRKVAPEMFQRDGETYYVAKTGKGYANANAANLQRFSERFKKQAVKPENLKVVELDGLEGGRFALQFVPEPSVEARNYSLHMAKRGSVRNQTAEEDALMRNDLLIDLMNDVTKRERRGAMITVDQLAQGVRRIIPKGSYLHAQLNELTKLARGQAVRVSFDNRYKPQNTNGRDPFGYYNSFNEVLWMNEEMFRTGVLNQQGDLISEIPVNEEIVATTFAEVVVHELLHMGTVNVATSLEADHPLRQELRAIRDDIVSYQRGLMVEHAQNPNWQPTGRQDYIAFRLELMTDVNLSGENITHGELETITYGLTDDVMRLALKNMPGYPNQQGRENQSMLRRFTDWVRGILRPGTSPLPVSESMYARVESLTNRMLELDDGLFDMETTQDLGIVEDLWAQVRDAEQLLDTPFKTYTARGIVDTFKPELTAAIARAEDLQVEMMKAAVATAMGNEQPETDTQKLMVQLQRALRDASLAYDSITERLIQLPEELWDMEAESGFDKDQLLSQPSFKSYATAYRRNRDFAPARNEKQRAWTDRMYEVLPDKLSDAWTATRDGIRGLGMLTMFTSQFVDYTKKWLPSVVTYYDTIRYRISERNDIHTKIQETVGEVAHWDHKLRTQLNGFLAESTYRGKWGFKPDWLPNATVDPAMKKRFDAMNEDQRRVAKNMFKQAHLMHEALQKELRGDIERVYDESIERAAAPARVQKLQAEKAGALAAHDKRQEMFRDAYLPLKRWGKWAVVYKSQAFKDAVARGNRKEIEKLKTDENHYMVAFADSQYAARQLRRDWEEEKGESIEDPFPRMRYDEQNELVPFDLLQRLKQKTADGTGIPKGISTKLDEALNRVYIEALAESSVRKSELRRIGVRGFDEDMVRAFVQHGQGVASLTSAIRINWQTRHHIEQMKDEAQNPKGGNSRKDTMAALNEILARHAHSLEPQDQGLQQKVMGFTSIWMLLTSPAYYIQNATQPFMMTLPQLAGEFGFGKASAHMTKAYKDVGSAWSETRGDTERQGELMDPEKIKDPHEKILIDKLLGLNLLDVGIAADLGSLAEARTAPMRLLNGVHHRMVTGVRTVEVFNRGVTALAAYRLAYEKYAKDSRMTEANARKNAEAYAIKQVEDTQGDYGGPNAPRLINKIPAGRLVTQFRKFQLIQIGLLTRTLHRKFKGATAEERAVGKRQFRYMLGVHAAIGGLTGLPAANLISMAVGMAFGVGDDDEPAGVEMRIRREIGDKAMADLVLEGMPSWAGLDASNRLGMGMTFSILPFTDFDLSRDGFLVLAGSLALGPTGAVGASMLNGFGKLRDGDVLGGTADMLPSLLKNSMKAYSYATEGIQTRTGITAITAEELNWFDLAAQTAGWPSKTISDRYEIYGMLIETEEFFRNRTGKIKRAYTEAYEEGDASEMAEARDEWRRLQQSRRDYKVGEVQSLSVLLKAPREKREKEDAMIGGVPTERTNRQFVQELFE